MLVKVLQANAKTGESKIVEKEVELPEEIIEEIDVIDNEKFKAWAKANGLTKAVVISG